MELYQLEHFIAVVEEHSFTRAAERVSRTQGAVSVSIRKLEEDLGVPLMVRDPHECTLTEAGQVLLEYARRILRLRDDLQSRMADIRNLVVGHVTVAAHESAIQYLLPAPLAAFHFRHPDIKITTRLCDGQQIAHMVAVRDADLGFGIRQTNLHGLRSELLHDDQAVLVATPGHPLVRMREVGMTDLRDEHFFIHSRRTPMLGLVERLFAEHAVPFHVAAELANFETIKQFVRTGSGLAIVPVSAARPDLDAGHLVQVRVEHLEIPRPIEVVFAEASPLPPAPARLLDLLRAWAWEGPAHERSSSDD